MNDNHGNHDNRDNSDKLYNVLIVDDEQEIRTGLKLKMNWESLGFRVAGEAKDGQDALAQLEASEYHVLLTDIKMPIMSGLELLKRASARYPDLKVIVLSGFDDFHYVKAAMQCGARDYLLKPVVRKELAEIIGKLRAELDDERRRQSEQSRASWKLQQSLPAVRERLVLALIGDDGEEHVLPLRGDIEALQLRVLAKEGARLRIMAVEMRLPQGRLDGEGAGPPGLLRLAFQMMCREIAQGEPFGDDVFAFQHPGYPNMMFFLLAAETDEREERIAAELTRQVQEGMTSHLRVAAVIALGEAVRELTCLRRAFLSTLMAWSRSQAGAVSQTVRADEAPAGSASASASAPASAPEAEPLPPELEKRLLLLLEDADLEGFMQAVTPSLTERCRSLQELHAFLLRVVLLLEQAVAKSGAEPLPVQEWLFPVTQWRFTTHAAALAYVRERAGQVADAVRRSRASGGAAVAEAVRQHVDAHYMSEISLSMLADRFHINTTYLSELFKKQIGTTFSDYLVQVRIRKAAELLSDPNLRLADIAELVGFANASYLSSVFKKWYGVSPNEYRMRLTGDKNR